MSDDINSNDGSEMSSEDKELVVACCANCGAAEIEDVKLKDCDKCDLARYCGDKCQQDHLERHEETCKERAADLRDEILFRQPESSCFGDCPICFLPMPLDQDKSTISSCCGKKICIGCFIANKNHEIGQRLKHKCPFCRKEVPKTNKEAKTRLMKRAAANDPFALHKLGATHYNGGDHDKAFEYYSRAAELDNAETHYNLFMMYYNGEGVDKDEEKEIQHLEEAAIAGHPEARYSLGCRECRNRRYDRAVKHWIIAANFGHDESMQILKEGYKLGHVSKDDLAAAFRAHQAAVDARKSPQREAAEEYM